MDVEIGSNLYRNTDGTVEIEGLPQMTMALKKPEGPLLVNFVMFDDMGRVVMKVVDSSMAFNERRAYDLEKTPTRLMIKHVDSGDVVLLLELTQPGRVAMKRAAFLSIKGHPFEVSADEWKVQKSKMSRADTDVKGGPIVLG